MMRRIRKPRREPAGAPRQEGAEHEGDRERTKGQLDGSEDGLPDAGLRERGAVALGAIGEGLRLEPDERLQHEVAEGTDEDDQADRFGDGPGDGSGVEAARAPGDGAGDHAQTSTFSATTTLLGSGTASPTASASAVRSAAAG